MSFCYLFFSSSTTTKFAEVEIERNEYIVEINIDGRNMLDARLCEEEMKIEDIIISLSSLHLHRRYLMRNLVPESCELKNENHHRSADCPALFQTL